MKNCNQRDPRRASFGVVHSFNELSKNLVSLTYNFTDLANKVREAEEAIRIMLAIQRENQND